MDIQQSGKSLKFNDFTFSLVFTHDLSRQQAKYKEMKHLEIPKKKLKKEKI